MKRGQMLIITAIVVLVSLGAVFMWAEGGITQEFTIGEAQAQVFNVFALGQTITNYVRDSAEISSCLAIYQTIDAAKNDKIVTNKQDYFEEMFYYNLITHMASFPKVKKTSLDEDFALYSSLFYEVEFDYPTIKGAPARVIYEGEPFTDYLEIVGDSDFIYKIRPIFSIEVDNGFFESDDFDVPDYCIIVADLLPPAYDAEAAEEATTEATEAST